MKKLFNNKNYFLLFQGSLVSAIGTSLYSFAAGLYVQDLFGKDNGAVYLSLFMAVGIIIRILFSPIAGAIADKLNKVRILYVTDFIRGGLFFITLYILSLGFPKEILIWILLGVTALSSLNQAFFGPAATSVIPEIVGDDLIQQANGANTIINSLQSILGVIAGMFLYALLGFETAVLINAISFIFSAFSEMFIKTNKELAVRSDDAIKPSFIDDVKFGFKYLVKKEGLLTLMLFSLVLNFCFTPVFGVGIPYLLRTELQSSTFEFGVVEIVFSVTTLISGFIVGGMKLKSLTHSVKKGIFLMTATMVLMTISMIFITYTGMNYYLFYGIFIAINIMLGFVMIYTNVPINTGLMKAIEPKVRGRVFSSINALSMGAMPIAVIAGGFLVDEFNVASMSIIFSVILVVTTVFFISNSKVTRLLVNIDKKPKVKQSNTEYEFDPEIA